jgi:YD repeat-containing protein
MATVIDIQYLYPTGQNNGRISQSIDSLTGDTVNYSYDALNRLTHAETAGPQWGQSYTFDGFGNLTAKTVTKGTAFNWTNAADPCGPTLHPAT